MSSRLPDDVRAEFDAMWRRSDGTYRCAGYKRGPHGRLPKSLIHIDHIKPEVDHPELRHDPRNLQPLCAPPGGGGCHRAKTSDEARRRAAGGDADWALRALAVVPLWGAVVLAVWAWFTLTDASDAAGAWLDLAARLTAGAVALPAAFYALRWWARKGQEPSEPLRASQPAARRAAAEARAILGKAGDVTVEGVVPEDFVLGYAGTGFDDHKDDARAELVAYLAGKLGVRLVADWDASHDRVHLRKRPALPRLVEHPGIDPDAPWWKIPVAPEVEIDLHTTAHVLVVGATGAGKTVVIRSIVERFAFAGRHDRAEVHLGDPKMIELLGFRGMPGIKTIATTDDALWALPFTVQAEMNRRYAAFRDDGVPLDSHDPLLLVIDEYEEFVDRMEAYWPTLPKDDEHAKRPGMKNPCLGAMKSVLRMARRANIHVVIGTQRPDASWFGGSARDNLQGRIGVGRLSVDAARMAFGSSEHGRDVPLDAKGRSTVQLGSAAPVECQAYWVPDRMAPSHSAVDAAILARLGA